MDGLKAVGSVYVAGQWRDATWLAEVVDPETGELVLTATVLEDGQGAPVVAALRMDMGLARGLRLQAGLPPQFQVEARRMRARMTYVADVLRSARRMLDTPTEDEVDGLLLHAIGQLRMADGSDEGRCYDCRTTGERIEALEAVVSEQAMQIETLLFRINDTQDSLQRHYSRIQAMEIVWRALGTSARKRGELEATIQAAYDANNDAGTVTWIDMTLLRMMQGMAKQLAKLSDMVGGGS